jgi:hypothetical protein
MDKRVNQAFKVRWGHKDNKEFKAFKESMAQMELMVHKAQ